jgi:signal transduction histidine kinase
MVGVSRDVTAEREAAQERERLLASEQRARATAEQQGRLKDEFLATLSHELRTPMNVVLGWLDILASGASRRDLTSTLELIRRNAQLQAKLIDELLDMNHLVSGNLRLELGIVDLGAAIQSTIQGLKPAADAKNIELTAAIDPSPVQVAADNQRVQQILWNLVHNAIKFTEPGGRVESSVRRVDRQVHVVVRDSGRGIAVEFLPHVFERFRQEDSSPTREFFGLGLGLSISKHLVEAHGGTIEAHSEGRGHGATFTVKLPVGAPVGVGAPAAQVAVSDDSARSLSA